MKRFPPFVLAFSILLAMSCDNTNKDTGDMPLRKEIMVKVMMEAPSGNAWDFMKERKIHYRTDAGDEGVADLSADSVFCADVSARSVTISAYIGRDRDSLSCRTTFVKTFLSSEEDLKEGMFAWSESARIEANSAVVKLIPATAGVRLRFFDSRHFALGERILEINLISSMMDTTTLVWSPEDANVALKVNDYYKSSFAGLAVAPQKPSEVKFSIVTNRNRYGFTFNGLPLEAGTVTDIALDFSKPDVQPKRKVGILGDSISTFFGYIDPSYSAYYPGEDAKGTNTVQSVDKTYWWKVINEKMTYGELDVNNSYSGARVISEGEVKGFVDRAYKFKDPDIIIIHGGTNDTTKSTELGDYDFRLPIEQLNDLCYRSAYVKLIKMLQNRYEGVEIIVLVGDWLTAEYARSNIEIAEYFSLPCVDFTNGGTIMNDTVNIPKSRGGHPDAKGHQYMADKIFEQCRDYLP